jgi:hypothetical protein
MVFLIASYGYGLRTVDGYHLFSKPDMAQVITVLWCGYILTACRKIIVFMLLIAICLLIDILAMVLFMRDALKPGTFLTMNCFQTGFFGGICIMEIVAVSRGRSEAGLGFSIFVL